MVGDRVVIPAEAGLQGKIVEVRSPGRFSGRSSLVLELTRLAYNGKSYQLRTSPYCSKPWARVPHVAPPLDRERPPVLRGETAEATTMASSIPALAARDVVPAGSASSDAHSTDQKAPAGTLIAPPASPQATTAVAALPPPSEKVTVPYGSVLSVRLLESVNSDLNQPGDQFVASLASPVMVGDRVVIGKPKRLPFDSGKPALKGRCDEGPPRLHVRLAWRG